MNNSLFRLKLIPGYIEHCIRSRPVKNISHPFVRNLIAFATDKKNAKKACKDIENLRNELAVKNEMFSFTDMGAGSNLSDKGKKQHGFRPLKKVIQTSVSPKYGRLLHALSGYLKPPVILELGTSVGISTAYLAMGHPEGIVYTIEGNPASAALAGQNFSQLGLSNINIINAPFDVSLPQLLPSIPKPGLIFIDGNHRKKPLLDYFALCAAHSDTDAVFVFDDIRWSKEMLEAWVQIISRKEVALNLDFFRMGIAYLGQDSGKQHYKIWY